MIKKTGLKWLLLLTIIIFSSCRNKTIQLLSKKWDCVSAENLVPPGQKFQNAQDSVNAIQLQNLVGALSWTFNEDLEYACAVSGRVVVRGTYELMDDEKVLICTPSTRNNINRYVINTLTENDLVLKSNTNNTPIILHFKPN
ncbi:MAG TPA: hypothetical protein VK489_05050 [Ferruginibacter sp.]|nr:hypothetical protein [Ferruginibacter sp.]